ncbi:hypothetical protein CY35_03G011900 [Sphagnum magellanicum]|nr:hypothetical protein CY35_03G011900 [Sphagnum magellanicum]KAH9567090.1 hypothetical protein CY35_03G011900 [Sphagnum magellanicum]
MSGNLESKSRKELKELCNQFGIRTAGVKHEDMVRLLRSKLQPKSDVSRSSPRFRATKSVSMTDNQLRIENRGSGGKTPKKLSSFGRTLGTVLHDANGVSASERRRKEATKMDVPRISRSNSARLLTRADFPLDENDRDAFSSADVDSVCSLPEPSECSIDDVPSPFETAESGHGTSARAQELEDEFHDATNASVARYSSGGESVATGRILEGGGLRDVPVTEGLEGEAECGYVGVTMQDEPGIKSTPEQNMESVTSTPAGEGVDDTDLATSSSSAQNEKFEESAEEELNTSNEPNPGLSLPLATELVSSELVEAGSHIPADSLNDLTKDLQGENTDALPVLCTLNVGMLEDTLASQVHLETEAWEVSEVAGVDSAKAPVLDTTAENFSNPTNILEGSVQKICQEPMEALVSERAENSVPSTVSEHATGNTTKVYLDFFGPVNIMGLN